MADRVDKTQIFNGKKIITGLSYISLIMAMTNMLFHAEFSGTYSKPMLIVDILFLLSCILWYRFISNYNDGKTPLLVFCVLGIENFLRFLTDVEFLPCLVIAVLDAGMAVLSYNGFKKNLISRLALIITALIEAVFGLFFNPDILFMIGKLTFYTGIYLFVSKNKGDIDSFSLKKKHSA